MTTTSREQSAPSLKLRPSTPKGNLARPLFVEIDGRCYPFTFGLVRQVKKGGKEAGTDRHLYVIEARELRAVKVGLADNIQNRLNYIQTDCPAYVEVRHQFRVFRPAARWVEQMAHRHLQEHRIRGEWFSCSADVAAGAAKHALSFMGDFVFFWENRLWLRSEWKAAMRKYRHYEIARAGGWL